VFGLVQLAPSGKVPESWQLAGLIVVTALVQLMRRRSFFEVTGVPDARWWRNLAAGAAIGVALWLVTTLVLVGMGATRVQFNGGLSLLTAGLASMVAAAVLEELLFRGFVFQRLCDGLGPMVALAITSAHFTLVHMNNPGMSGLTRGIAMLNIFIASVAFGLAYLRTQSLALPIGMHVFANITQGPILGFGVSGIETPHLFTQRLTGPDWLTGGAFGLEASVPGTIAIACVAVALWRVRPGQLSGHPAPG
jgi:membrane protease YdiL (CAAX protease family)